MLVYTKIKQICDEKGVSVASVERDAGLTNGSISKWNNSKPIAENLHSVAKVLGTTVEDLLEEKEERNASRMESERTLQSRCTKGS